MHRFQQGVTVEDPLSPYAEVDRRRRDRWVMANMVGSLSGSAAVGGRVSVLSDDTDFTLFLAMRSLADVVVVGAETVRREGYGPVRLAPERAARRAAAGRVPDPPLAVVTRSLDLDWESRLFRDVDPASRTIVLTCRSADPDRMEAAAEVADVVVAGDERVEPDEAFDELARRGYPVVLCEGGPTWLGEVAAAGLLDELCLTLAPVLGGDPLPLAVWPVGLEVSGLELREVLGEASTLFLRYERPAS